MKKTASDLKAWRAANRLTQAQAAETLGVLKATYQNWEAGRTMPYPKILEMALNNVALFKRVAVVFHTGTTKCELIGK